MYNQVIKSEEAELFISSYMYCCRYGIHVSRFGDERLLESKDYGLMTPLSDDLRALCSDRVLIELCYNYDYNLKKVLLALRSSKEVDWN